MLKDNVGFMLNKETGEVQLAPDQYPSFICYSCDSEQKFKVMVETMLPGDEVHCQSCGYPLRMTMSDCLKVKDWVQNAERNFFPQLLKASKLVKDSQRSLKRMARKRKKK